MKAVDAYKLSITTPRELDTSRGLNVVTKVSVYRKE